MWSIPLNADEARLRFSSYAYLKNYYAGTSLTISNSYNNYVVILRPGSIDDSDMNAVIVDLAVDHTKRLDIDHSTASSFFSFIRTSSIPGVENAAYISCYPEIPMTFDKKTGRLHDAISSEVVICNAHIQITMGITGPSVTSVTLTGVRSMEGVPTIVSRDIGVSNSIVSYITSLCIHSLSR